MWRLPLEILELGGDEVAEPLAERELLGALRQQRVVERMAVAPPRRRRVAPASAALGDRAVLDAFAPAAGELAEGRACGSALLDGLDGLLAALEPGDDRRAVLARAAVLRLARQRVAALAAIGRVARAALALPGAAARRGPGGWSVAIQSWHPPPRGTDECGSGHDGTISRLRLRRRRCSARWTPPIARARVAGSARAAHTARS